MSRDIKKKIGSEMPSPLPTNCKFWDNHPSRTGNINLGLGEFKSIPAVPYVPNRVASSPGRGMRHNIQGANEALR